MPLVVDWVLGAGGGPAERGDVGAKGEDSSNIVSDCARLVFIDGNGESNISIKSKIQEILTEAVLSRFQGYMEDAPTCEGLREGTWIQ